MAFDETRLPLRISYGATGGPQFMTDVVTIQGGYERRNQNWAHARRVFDAKTGVRSAQDGGVLLGFFQARAGKARGFRLKDWSDYTSAVDGKKAPTAFDQVIGSGDAMQTAFQLIKTYGDTHASYVRDIRKPVEDTIKISVDNVEYETEWSADLQTGMITFSSPPATGAVIKAGYEFDVPVRFDTDVLNLRFDNDGVAETTKDIPLIEVRV